MAACHPALLGSVGAAVSIETGSQEDLLVIQEIGRAARGSVDLVAVARTAARAVLDAHGVRAAEILFVPQWSLPRTSSGKVIRARSRQAYLDGTLTVLARTGGNMARELAT